MSKLVDRAVILAIPHRLKGDNGRAIDVAAPPSPAPEGSRVHTTVFSAQRAPEEVSGEILCSATLAGDR
jgi:hypothetical protein